MTDPHAIVEGLTPAVAQKLRILSGGMGAGILGFALFVAWTYFSPGETVSHANAPRFINIMTMVAMGWTLAGIAAGEFAWRQCVRRVENPAEADATVQMGFTLRLAFREGTAILGLVVCFLGAGNGVLRAYPAYWVNAAPAALFLFFLWARWPSFESLRAQVKDALPFA